MEEEEEKEEVVKAIGSLLESANDLHQSLDETAALSEGDKKLKSRLLALMKNIQTHPSFTKTMGSHKVELLGAFKRLEKSINKAIKKATS